MGRKRKTSSGITIPYLEIRGGRAYWAPKNVPPDSGCEARPLGPAGPDAESAALRLYQRLLKARRGGIDLGSPVRTWPRGSIGEGWDRYRRTSAWTDKAPRTREEWERCWLRIEPVFGDVAPSTIPLELIDAFRDKVRREVSLSEAHRVIKVWRALWNVLAALGYCAKGQDPSLALRNTAPQARTETWQEWELARIAKRAWREGYSGLATALALLWDGMASPVDVRTLTLRQRLRSPAGSAFRIYRAKTGEASLAPLTRRSERILEAYLAKQNVVPVDQPFIRTREGAVYRKNSLAEDFRDMRTLVFGREEKRQLRDIRRTGAMEAVAGQADPKAMADAMGNSIDKNRALQKAYTPTQMATVMTIPEARRRGRKAQREAE